MKKTDQAKTLLLEQLKKTPIIQIACEKLGIARATYYRWKTENAAYSKAIDDALLDGRLLVNDLAESQLIAAVKDRNMTAILAWLRHHHNDYRNRLEIEGTVHSIQELTQEQKMLVKKALTLMGINLEKYDDQESEAK